MPREIGDDGIYREVEERDRPNHPGNPTGAPGPHHKWHRLDNNTQECARSNCTARRKYAVGPRKGIVALYAKDDKAPFDTVIPKCQGGPRDPATKLLLKNPKGD